MHTQIIHRLLIAIHTPKLVLIIISEHFVVALVAKVLPINIQYQVVAVPY